MNPYTKTSIYAPLFALVLFIVAISSFMAGCEPDLPGTCPYYNPIRGTLVDFYSKTITCKTCDKTEKCTNYNCYDWFAHFSDKNIHCHSLIASKQTSPPINTTYYSYNNDNKFIIGNHYMVYYMKLHPGTCLTDINHTLSTNTIVGIIGFLLFGFVFFYIILSCISNSSTEPRHFPVSTGGDNKV